MNNVEEAKAVARASENAVKKPAPDNIREWINELHGMQKWIDRKGFYSKHMGPKWASHQELYFKARISFLLSNIPTH